MSPWSAVAGIKFVLFVGTHRSNFSLLISAQVSASTRYRSDTCAVFSSRPCMELYRILSVSYPLWLSGHAEYYNDVNNETNRFILSKVSTFHNNVHDLLWEIFYATLTLVRWHKGQRVAEHVPSSRLKGNVDHVVRIMADASIHFVQSQSTHVRCTGESHPHFLDDRTVSPRRPHSSNTHLLLWSALWSPNRDVRYDVWGRRQRLPGQITCRRRGGRPRYRLFSLSTNPLMALICHLTKWEPLWPACCSGGAPITPRLPLPFSSSTLVVAKTPTWGRAALHSQAAAVRHKLEM